MKRLRDYMREAEQTGALINETIRVDPTVKQGLNEIKMTHGRAVTNSWLRGVIAEAVRQELRALKGLRKRPA